MCVNKNDKFLPLCLTINSVPLITKWELFGSFLQFLTRLLFYEYLSNRIMLIYLALVIVKCRFNFEWGLDEAIWISVFYYGTMCMYERLWKP